MEREHVTGDQTPERQTACSCKGRSAPKRRYDWPPFRRHLVGGGSGSVASRVPDLCPTNVKNGTTSSIFASPSLSLSRTARDHVHASAPRLAAHASLQPYQRSRDTGKLSIKTCCKVSSRQTIDGPTPDSGRPPVISLREPCRTYSRECEYQSMLVSSKV
jgi:hypothetical protein